MTGMSHDRPRSSRSCAMTLWKDRHIGLTNLHDLLRTAKHTFMDSVWTHGNKIAAIKVLNRLRNANIDSAFLTDESHSRLHNNERHTRLEASEHNAIDHTRYEGCLPQHLSNCCYWNCDTWNEHVFGFVDRQLIRDYFGLILFGLNAGKLNKYGFKLGVA